MSKGYKSAKSFTNPYLVIRLQELLFRGRIRVQLKNDEGQPINGEFPTRESILMHLCSMIPQLKSRQGGAAGGGVQGQAQQQQASTHHKKGKGKRR